MISTLKKITTKGIVDILFQEKENGFKYSVLSVDESTPSLYELIQTEDIFSKYRYLGKLIYNDNVNCVYRVIPYPVKERIGEKIIKNERLIDELFENSLKKITLKYTTEENYTEYLSISLKDIFKEISPSNFNTCKPLIFPKIHSIEDFVPLMSCPNGDYSIVAKK